MTRIDKLSNSGDLIILGAGISGLTAGIYAQMAGYSTTLFEKNAVPGGECMGWDRKGYHIDGCIHWLTGTNPANPLYKVWEDVGALGSDVEVYNPESFCVIETPKGLLHLYNDMDRLKKHLYEFAPEDQESLEGLYAAIEAIKDSNIPMSPPEMMGPAEIIKMLGAMKKQGKVLKAWEISLAEYVERYKNPYLKTLLLSVLPPAQSASVLPFTLATVMTGNGGRPRGGSRAMALRMAEKYRSLGGTLRLSTPVDEIIVENGRAVGVRLAAKNDAPGEFIPAGHIMSATDVHVTLDRFLRGKYPLEDFRFRDADPKTYPAPTCCLAAFGLDIDVRSMAPDMLIDVPPFHMEGKETTSISMKHYCYEPSFAPAGHSVLLVLTGGDYDWWKALASDETGEADRNHIASDTYIREKERVLDDMAHSLVQKFPEWEGHIEPLDFVTPLTYERYCGAYRGQWMSYGMTEHGKRLLHNGKIKGLENFSMCGQWLMAPGGTPVALITGRWAVQRLVKKDKLPRRF